MPPLGERRALAIRDGVLALTDPASRFADLARNLYER